MDKRILTAAATAALLAGGGQATAAIITIDTFDTEQRVWDLPDEDDGDPGRSSQIEADEAIGDFRELHVDTDGSGEADTELEVADGQIAFNNDEGITGRAWITYDGAGGFDDVGFDPDNVDTDGLNVDLFDGPIGAGFIFDVVEADADIFIEITAWDLLGNMVSYAELLPEGGGDPFVPFAALTNGGDFDWNQVGALQFFAQSGADSDIPSLDGAISAIRVDTGVIPLPASAFLLLGGVGGLSVLGARRRRKS